MSFKPRRLVLTGVLALLGVLASLAVAQAGTPLDFVYTGCLGSKTGDLYRVTSSPASPRPCAQSDRQVSWNRSGPAGPPGLPGARGVARPQGAGGASDIAMTSHTIADDGHVFASGYSFKQILAFAVQPAHSYTFAVKALANLEPVEGISDVTCDLDRFNAAGDDIRTLDTDDFDKYIQYGIDATLTLDAGLNTSEGGTARLLCRGTNNAISSATSS